MWITSGVGKDEGPNNLKVSKNGNKKDLDNFLLKSS